MRLITGYLGEIFILLTCHNRLQKFRVRLITECALQVKKYGILMWGKVVLKLSKCHSLSPTAALNENIDDHSKTLILLTVNSLVINLVITKM